MIQIHARIHERHPEISEDDVRCAWENQYRTTLRMVDSGERHVAVGLDTKGRDLEMVAVELESGDWLVYHAMTPPSQKTLAELGLRGRR